MEHAAPVPDEGVAHLVEPPIVDHLYYEADAHAFIVTFVPEDRVSTAETEAVEIPASGENGRRIAVQLGRLAELLGMAPGGIERVVHAGGGDFELWLAGGATRSLAEHSPDSHATHEAYRCLQDIAMTAQVAFIIQERSATLAYKA